MHKDKIKDAVYNVKKKNKQTKTERQDPFIDNHPGEKWIILFLKEYPLITQCNAKIISKDKVYLTKTNIQEWSQELQKHIKEENSFDILSYGGCVYNAVEKGFEHCPKTGKVITKKFMKISI